jgi:hypothetical protein
VTHAMKRIIPIIPRPPTSSTYQLRTDKTAAWMVDNVKGRNAEAVLVNL